MRIRRLAPALFFLLCAQLGALVGCVPAAPPRTTTEASAAFLDDLEERTFRYFWELADPQTALIPDRWPTPSFSSIAAVGFGLSGYAIGAERGYISRDEAVERTLQTLRFFARAEMGPAAAGTTGHRGFYYHFLDMETGERFRTVELSSIDTTLLLAGVLSVRGYFDRDTPGEREIRQLADTLYRAADWTWLQPRAPLVSMGWYPESGLHTYDWKGLDEAALLYILALGSPTHPISPEGWTAFTSTFEWETLYGQEHFTFGPLFGHHYSQAWIDFRGIRDATFREKGIDFFENSRRASLAHYAYAVANPMRWNGYGADLWGLSACDGPVDLELEFRGETRRFRTYSARGISGRWSFDDGTVTPSAAGGSLPFVPELALPALMAMRARYGEHLYSKYGFVDAFNPSFQFDVPVQHGRVVPGVGWFDTDYLGIDQGVMLVMIENYRSGLVWRLMRRDPYIVAGLRRAGFSGGWLESEP